MKQEQRLKSILEYEQGQSDPDPLPIPGVTLVANLSGRDRARPKEELARDLEERPIDSVEDACERFNVQVTGQYQGLDGEIVDTVIAVRNEETFTPDGLTRGDPGLLALYVAMRTYEQLASYLADKDRDQLTDAEIEHLRETERFLEEALRQEAS